VTATGVLLPPSSILLSFFLSTIALSCHKARILLPLISRFVDVREHWLWSYVLQAEALCIHVLDPNLELIL
jgi:hypothetical protein